MPNSRHSPAIFSPSNSRAMNLSRSSIGLHSFQGILLSRKVPASLTHASGMNCPPSLKKDIVYPGAHHGFNYPHLQPGMTLFDHWVEYNGEAADNASHRLHQFLDRHLN